VVLEGLGWRLHRIWSTDWWLNPDVEVKKLLTRLNKLLDDNIDEEAPAAESISETMEAEMVDSVPSSVVATDIDVSLARYKIVVPAGGKPEDFYDLAHGRKLTEQLTEIIEAEGPIHENVLHRRVARAWGLERTGTRIVDRLRMLTPREHDRTSDGNATFYWPANVNPGEWSVFRQASDEESSRRKVDDVCLEELANGVLHLLEEMGSAPTSDIARSVCRLIGMSRTPGDAEARVGLAISRLVTTGSVIVTGNLLRLS
jgi:hypothetical protein